MGESYSSSLSKAFLIVTFAISICIRRQKHAKVFLDLLSPVQVLEIVDECRQFIEAKVSCIPKLMIPAISTRLLTTTYDDVTSQVEDVLQLCIPALGTAIPPFHFPRFMYRTEGCFGFFEGKFKHLLDTEELEAHVFHCLREIGNGLSFLLLLSDIMVFSQPGTLGLSNFARLLLILSISVFSLFL